MTSVKSEEDNDTVNCKICIAVKQNFDSMHRLDMICQSMDDMKGTVASSLLHESADELVKAKMKQLDAEVAVKEEDDIICLTWNGNSPTQM